MRTRFWLKSLKGRDHSEDPGVAERIILKWILANSFGVSIGFILLRMEISGGGLF
jgi:hypothetical protein